MELVDYYVGYPAHKDLILQKFQDDCDDTLQAFNMTFNTPENRERIKQIIDIILRKYQEYFKSDIESKVYIPTDEYGIENHNAIAVNFKRK